MSYFLNRLKIKTAGDWAWLFMLLGSLLVVILPLFFLVKFSISDRSSIVTGGELMPLWPHKISFLAFKHFLFDSPSFLGAMWNSFKIAMTTIVFSMTLGTPVAFVFYGKHLFNRKF